MRVLELGNYIIPAYAGMLLAEQGARVTKWIAPESADPILSLKHGAELWQWINQGKTLEQRDAREILVDPVISSGVPDIILDNFRPSTLQRWGIDPQRIALDLDCVWVSMRSEIDETSFDLLAQARSWMEYSPRRIPFYVGDTTGGLFLAFKALAAHARLQSGHFILGQASCMQKLVEGELLDISHGDLDAPGTYEFDEHTQHAKVVYKGWTYVDHVHDRIWKLQHLYHKNGRILI